MTQALTDYKSWTVRDIESRQKELAEVALKIWKKA